MSRCAAVVRNPLLALPSAVAMQNLPPEAKVAMRALLLEASREARAKADKCWRTHKPPMAAYWKAWAVNFGHAARLLKAQQPRKLSAVKREEIAADAKGEDLWLARGGRPE